MRTDPKPEEVVRPRAELVEQLVKSREGHTCAVCPASIKGGFLMCVKHWRLVPKDEQQRVYRTWGSFQRANVRSGYFDRVRREYFEARDLAITSVQARLAPPPITTSNSIEGATP